MKLIRGVAYYAEFWPEERWATDLAMMREAGLNAIRVGEFAWPNLEPEEGRFTLDWLARLLDAAAEHGIGVVLCTPSACPPKWLTHRYPDTRLVLPDGRFHGDYIRKHYCPNSPRYRELATRIAAKLAEVAASHGRVLAWQVDNELGAHECGRCFCATCAAGFRAWLQARYGTLEELNRRWQTNYWGQRVSDWAEIELPAHRWEPSVSLDFCRFYHDSVVSFFLAQKQALRAAGAKEPISTNCMGPLYEALDYWQFAPHLDRTFYDMYFVGCNAPCSALGLDLFRSLKGAFFWLSETGTEGLRGPEPTQAQLRLWYYAALARGARVHMFFRWRTCLAGHEQNYPAFLNHAGRPNRGLAEARALFAEAAQLEGQLEQVPLPHSDAALLLDWQAVLARATPIEFRPHGIMQIQAQFLSWYADLLRRGVNMDVVGPGAELTRYKLIVMPGSANVIRNPDLAARLRRFVEDGGVLVATATVFSKDGDNNYYTEERPDGLTELLGVTVGETRPTPLGGEDLWDRSVLHAHINAGGKRHLAGEWLEELLPRTARILARYADGPFGGQPAVTLNAVGKGGAFYVGTAPDAGLIRWVLAQACRRAGVAVWRGLPQGVEYINCAPYHFWLNTTPSTRRVPGVPAGCLLLGKRTARTLLLPPYGVGLIKV